ncbi:hypothetical protein GCM10023083_26830 [Streptomyces phyllanthi]
MTRSTGDLVGTMEAVGFSDVDDAEPLADGWLQVEFADFGRHSAQALVRRTGAPVVMVSYLDSDLGFVEAALPGGGGWTGLLNPELAESYEIGPDEFPVGPAVAGAAAWSAAAGLVGDEALVRRAFTEHADFAEWLFPVLLAGLGIPGAELP